LWGGIHDNNNHNTSRPISSTLFTALFVTYALLIQAFVPNAAAFVGRASTSVSGTVIVEGVEFDTVRYETRKEEKKSVH
jgi:hypothetical protein